MASQIASIPQPDASRASVPEIDIQNAFEARVKPDLFIEKVKNDLKSADADFSQSIVRVSCADPLVCPKCSGPSSIISFIENSSVLEKILRHATRTSRNQEG